MDRTLMTSAPRLLEDPSSPSPLNPASLTIRTHGIVLSKESLIKDLKASCTCSCTFECNTLGMSSSKMIRRGLSEEEAEDGDGDGEDDVGWAIKMFEQEEAREKKSANVVVVFDAPSL
jgi:hypothetical protein